MKHQKVLVVILVVAAFAVLVCLYIFPNSVLRSIAPKRYVFLCINSTIDELFKKDVYKDGISSVFDIDISDNAEDIMKFKLIDNESVLGVSSELFGDKVKGIYKNPDNIWKYLSLNYVYNEAVDVKGISHKDFSISGGESTLYSANGYEIKFKENFKDKILSRIDGVVDDDLYNFIRDSIIPAAENAQIRVYTNDSHRIMSLSVSFTFWEKDIFLELTLKDKEAMADDISIVCSIDNNVSVNVSSSGNHTWENGIFSDNTEISVVLDFIRVFELTTEINAAKADSSFSFVSDGKLFRDYINIGSSGGFDGKMLNANFYLSTRKKDGMVVSVNQNGESVSYDVSNFNAQDRDIFIGWLKEFAAAMFNI